MVLVTGWIRILFPPNTQLSRVSSAVDGKQGFAINTSAALNECLFQQKVGVSPVTATSFQTVHASFQAAPS